MLDESFLMLYICRRNFIFKKLVCNRKIPILTYRRGNSTTGRILRPVQFIETFNREFICMNTEVKICQSDDNSKHIVYQTENLKDIDVCVAENTIWLTQSQIAELFATTPQNVTIHIRNIFKDKELEKKCNM